MADHELRLKASIDTSQVQQGMSSLSRAAGGGVQINTQRIDQAFQSLAAALNKFTSEMERAALKLASNPRSISKIAGGFSSDGGAAGETATLLKKQTLMFMGGGLTKVGRSLNEYLDELGWQTSGTKTATRAIEAGGGILGMAGAGATMGSIIPGFGTAAGAAIGAAIGAAAESLKWMAESAKEAKEAFDQLTKYRETLEAVSTQFDQRNEMKIALNGDPAERDKLLSRAQANVKSLEDESARLESTARRLKHAMEGQREITEAQKTAAEQVAKDFQTVSQALQHNQKIVDTINQAKAREQAAAEQAARKAAEEAARKAQWQHQTTISNSKAQATLENEMDIEGFGGKTDEELTSIQREAKKTIDEQKNKIKDLLEKRAQAIASGSEQLAQDLLEQIQAAEHVQQMAGARSRSATSELENRVKRGENTAEFGRRFGNKEEMTAFGEQITKDSLSSLRATLEVLNQQRNQQKNDMLDANTSGDFKNRDRIADELGNTDQKIKMVQQQMEKLKGAAGTADVAGKLSQMAQVGMYLSKSDMGGLNDPKVRMQQESNDILRKIESNTSPNNGGLE